MQYTVCTHNIGFCANVHVLSHFDGDCARPKLSEKLNPISSQGTESSLELEELEERRREGELLPGGRGEDPLGRGTPIPKVEGPRLQIVPTTRSTKAWLNIQLVSKNPVSCL